MEILSGNGACIMAMSILDLCQYISGPGKIVQIDESLFRHKPKVYYTDLYIKHM